MTAYRYLRARATALDTGTPYCACAELEFRATPGGADLTTGKTAIADSAFGGLPASQAIDNNAATFWANNGTGPGTWIGVDLGAGNSSDVQEVLWTVRPDASFRQAPTALEIEGSNDLATWGLFYSVAGIAWASAGETKTFTVPAGPTYARIQQAQRQVLVSQDAPVRLQGVSRQVLIGPNAPVRVQQMVRMVLRSPTGTTPSTGRRRIIFPS